MCQTSDKMKVLIAGSRSLGNRKAEILAKLAELRTNQWTCIISGGAIGPDRFGQEFARLHNIPIISFLPDWSTFGKSAGPLRNSSLVESADFAVIFYDSESRGTLDTINKLKISGKQYIVINM